MHLTQAQLDAYDRDGFLILPDLIPLREIDAAREALARACEVQDERVTREKGSRDVRILYGLHDPEQPTGDPAIDRLARSPAVLQPAMDVLRDQVYMFHSKANLKPAITGEIWQWHQDFGLWKVDGCPAPRLVTSLVMLDQATELGGCLYFVRGSHREPYIDAPYDDTTTATLLKAMSLEHMQGLVERHGEPVAVTGGPGTVAMFHPHLVHGSGHNMSVHARRQLYFVYNAVSNVMAPVANPRPYYKANRVAKPLQVAHEPVIEMA